MRPLPALATTLLLCAPALAQTPAQQKLIDSLHTHLFCVTHFASITDLRNLTPVENECRMFGSAHLFTHAHITLLNPGISEAACEDALTEMP